MHVTPSRFGGRALLAGALILTCMWLSGCAHPRAGTSRNRTQVDTNAPIRFVVSFPSSLRAEPISARVLLFLSQSSSGEPRFALDFFNLQPVFAIDVTNWAAGTPLVFDRTAFRDPAALAFPGPLHRLPAGSYRVQALIDLDNTQRDFATGPGNLYSQPRTCLLAGEKGGDWNLVCDQRVAVPEEPADTDWIKWVKVRSERLSRFHGRDIFLRAGVVVPPEFAKEPARQFPACYLVPGFGGRHTDARGWLNSEAGKDWQAGKAPLAMLRVFLDPDVPLGHSVFADSANNGPVGEALIRELLPEIESRFRAIPQTYARFVAGHSSGGWSSLWLQVTYPEVFGGCWSTAPDPVDFRAFQTMNLYEDRNGHWTREGYPRPVARSREKLMVTFQQLNLWELVTGYGGQLDSFDAVFSPKGPDGRPLQIMDKRLGTLNRRVAEAWKRYDIRLILEQNWARLAPQLRDKLHVIGAGWDSFYLDPAVELLREFLQPKAIGGYVEILPGDHGSVMTKAVRDRLATEMAEAFERGRKSAGAAPAK